MLEDCLKKTCLTIVGRLGLNHLKQHLSQIHPWLQVLASGASTMIPESQLEPVATLPDLEAWRCHVSAVKQAPWGNSGAMEDMEDEDFAKIFEW